MQLLIYAGNPGLLHLWAVLHAEKYDSSCFLYELCQGGTTA